MLFTFRVDLNNRTYMDAPIESCGFGTRAVRCLQRIGIPTVGALVERISKQSDLMDAQVIRARALGAVTAEEIMKGLFDYYCRCLPEDKLGEYLLQTIMENRGFTKYKVEGFE